MKILLLSDIKYIFLVSFDSYIFNKIFKEVKMANRSSETAVLAQKYYEQIEMDALLTRILKHLGKTRPEKPITTMVCLFIHLRTFLD